MKDYFFRSLREAIKYGGDLLRGMHLLTKKLTLVGILASSSAILMGAFFLYDRFSEPDFTIVYTQAPQPYLQFMFEKDKGLVSVSEVEWVGIRYIFDITNTGVKDLFIKHVYILPESSIVSEIFEAEILTEGGKKIEMDENREFFLDLNSQKIDELKRFGVTRLTVEVETSVGTSKKIRNIKNSLDYMMLAIDENGNRKMQKWNIDAVIH